LLPFSARLAEVTKRTGNLLCLLPALLLAGACRAGAPPSATTSAGQPADVLLITIDTLRADRLGSYGYRTAATPNLDALAARGARFATGVAHAPLTGPSHASILTGLTPLGHGLRDNGGFVLPASARTAAEDFKAAGYHTGAFVSGFPLDRRFGFARGFDVYDDHLPRGNDRRRTPYVERFGDATTDAALRWLASPTLATPARRFLWVHYYDPHAPYEPPGELADRFRTAPYDGEIAFVDRQIGRLLEALARSGRLERTLVLVTADHGESLGEHGEGTHGLFLYDATLKVPWIVAGPGIAGGRVPGVVARGIDVLPTLLDYAGQKLRTDLDGRTLRPALEGRAMDDAPTYAESLYSEREFGWAPLHAWRTARLKLIDAPRPELYDLEQDAGELKSRAEEDTARASELQRRLTAALARPVPAAKLAADPETAERLRALGYLGGGQAQPRQAGALRDPKDGVRLLPRLNRGISAARIDPPLAIKELTAVLAEDPGLLMARRSRAVAYASAGQHDLAIADLRLLEKEGLLTAEDGVVLGDNLRFADRLEEATAVLEHTARSNPQFAQPRLSLAEVHLKAGRREAAVASFEEVLKLVPDHLEALRGLGDLAFIRGDLAGAEKRYGRLLEVEPTDPGAKSRLGVLRMRAGRTEDARRLFEEAIAREPTNAEALLYLAGVFVSGGNAQAALPYFERAVAADPRSTMALNGLGLARLAVGDTARAAAAFRDSLRLDPKQPDIARSLAELQASSRGRE
jgi:choline-sulfatase